MLVWVRSKPYRREALLGLGAQLAGHRYHSVIRGTEGRAVPVEGKQQMMRQGSWEGPPSLHGVGVLRKISRKKRLSGAMSYQERTTAGAYRTPPADL